MALVRIVGKVDDEMFHAGDLFPVGRGGNGFDAVVAALPFAGCETDASGVAGANRLLPNLFFNRPVFRFDIAVVVGKIGEMLVKFLA